MKPPVIIACVVGLSLLLLLASHQSFQVSRAPEQLASKGVRQECPKLDTQTNALLQQSLVGLTGDAATAHDTLESYEEAARLAGISQELGARTGKSLLQMSSGAGLIKADIPVLIQQLGEVSRLSGNTKDQDVVFFTDFEYGLKDGVVSLHDFAQITTDATDFAPRLGAGLGMSGEELNTLAAEGGLTTNKIVYGLTSVQLETNKLANEVALMPDRNC